MQEYRININGKELTGFPGQTILDVARENDIFIPTLCYDEKTEIYGACGLCMVEVEGSPKIFKACATEISPGMVIRTDSERIRESRKTNLELLLSNHTGDCNAPCTLNCPAHTDCQGYVGLVANGEYLKANELIKEKIPLPASIGRVCPHPCEDNCRRQLVDQPISIAMIKRFCGDFDHAQEQVFIPDIPEETGRSVAIIGGGPMGLSAAYFLRRMGHAVTIYDAMPKLGGMMRYGIPEYRLPKAVLDAEIDVIHRMGAEFITDTKVGEDISLDEIRNSYDAVLIGIGAWLSTGVRCKGEDSEGVIGGIRFLRAVQRNEPIDLGKRVAIVGGGNTAMDACRTAVRLGAEEVYNVYRRTKKEMPAEQVEIEEAEEEGVVFLNLRNPLEIKTGKNGRVSEMVLQVMELGEADASGRRKPVPVEGKTETIDVDTVILAIGQKVDAEAFALDKTKKGAIQYDPETFMTSIPGVFAGGDCGNDKISIAVEAIADALKSTQVIDRYLEGEAVKYRKPYVVTRDDISEKTFEDRERLFREKADQLDALERKNNFSEIIYDGLSPEQAEREADRCLQCGCHDFFECKLIDFANQYGVEPERIAGEKHVVDFKDDHPFIVRDPNKCILCGLCVRTCGEVMGIHALGLVQRGFNTTVKPSLEQPLLETACDSCGMCVTCCPVGAIQEIQTTPKEVPLETEVTTTTCANCAVGCTLDVESYGGMLIKANPADQGFVNKGLCCAKGKWGFDVSLLSGKEESPLMRGKDGALEETDYYDAFVGAVKGLQSVKARHGAGSIAVSVSDRYTNEELYVMKKFAGSIGARIFSFNNRHNGLREVVGFDASPNTIDELLSTDLIILPAFIKNRSAVIWNKIREAAQGGAKLVVINTKKAATDFDVEHKTVETANDLKLLKGIAKVLVDAGKGKEWEGYEALAKSLAAVKPTDQAREIAALYMQAKKAMIVFQQNVLSEEAARMIGNLALLSGHIGSPRDGILMVKAKNNSQGLVDLGITAGEEALEGVKGLLIFGEDPKDADLSHLEFLAVSDVFMTDTAEEADVFIPATGSMSSLGTFTNTERRLLPVEPVIDEGMEFSNWQIAAGLAEILEEDYGFEEETDISAEMEDRLPVYKYTDVGEILGGALAPIEGKLVKVKEAKLVDELVCTDTLMNTNAERIPLPGSGRKKA